MNRIVNRPKKWRRLIVLKRYALEALAMRCLPNNEQDFEYDYFYPILLALEGGISETELGITREALLSQRKDFHRKQVSEFFAYFKGDNYCTRYTVNYAQLKCIIDKAVVVVGCTLEELNTSEAELKVLERVSLVREGKQAVANGRLGFSHFYDSLGIIQQAIEAGVSYQELGTSKAEFNRFKAQAKEKWNQADAARLASEAMLYKTANQ